MRFKLNYSDEQYIKLIAFLLGHKISRKLGLQLAMEKAKEVLGIRQ
nr:MAG TPA: hypothetical protein [Caudoviricetes sp.]